MKKPGIFYGYYVLAACFLNGVFFAGCGPGAFSLFVNPLETDMGWSRTEIMAAFTIFLLCTALTSPLAGWLVDRYGARRVIPLGALLGGTGLVLLSQMDSLWHYYVGYAVIGMGLNAMGPIPSSYVVSQWFRHRRGRAIGVMSMGMGTSGIIFPPLVGIYLIPHFGWSNAYLALAVIATGLTIPLSLFVIRTKPADMGLSPDGAEASETASIAEAFIPASEGLSPKMALATPAFWLLAASVTLYHNHMGILQNQVPYLGDIGFPISIAAACLSVNTAVSIPGVLFFGWLCDKIPAKFASVIGLGLTALGILIFINIGPGSPTGLIWLYAVIMGFGVSSWLPSLSMLTNNAFGLASYGAIFGMLSFFQSFGAAIGPLIIGYFYDSMGTYYWAFIIILAMVILAMPLVLAVRRPSSYPTPKA